MQTSRSAMEQAHTNPASTYANKVHTEFLWLHVYTAN